jgi:hypothetical protein
VDFDKDGLNDVIFTSANPNQLVVQFATDTGLETRPISFLNGPGNATALTVADFNNDGFLDIATASGNASSAGVYVFLATTDPITGNFAGFADPTINPLPAYTNLGYYESPVSIVSLAAGDFDNDGDMDIAAFNTQAQIFPPEQVPGVSYFLNDGASGYLRADPGVFAKDEGVGSLLKATALQVGGPDVLLSAARGADKIKVLRYQGGVVTSSTVLLGKVDTNRFLNTELPPNQEALQNATLQDFAVVDANGDGNADLVAVTKEPLGYLVTFQGNGVGGFVKTSSTPTALSPNGDDNSGIQIVGELSDGGLGVLIDSIQGLLPSGDANGVLRDVTLVTYSTRGVSLEGGAGSLGNPPFVELNLNPGLDGASLVNVQPPYPEDGVVSRFDLSLDAYDVYNPNGSATPSRYLLAAPVKDRTEQNFYNGIYEFSAANGVSRVSNIMDYALDFFAGNGGDGLTGKGGAGGTVGNTLKITNGVVSGDFNVVLPADSYRVSLVGGDGGNGFLDAGRGGSVKGVSVRYSDDVTVLTSTVSMFAGYGGDSASETGGAGGELAGFSLASGSVLFGGAGGRGYIGGAGGSVRGDAFPDFVAVNGSVSQGSSIQYPTVIIRGGEGGAGQKTGGAGGGVIKVKARFLPIIGGAGGVLDYQAGDGGAAVAGQGGAGGSVQSVSPTADGNNLAGSISLRAGAGGAGGTGGAGGSVNDFVNTPSGGLNPTVLSVLAGAGGRGISGNGGTGGSIANINATALGLGVDLFGNPLSLNRLLAGNGGDSAGGNGGKGGGITNLASGSVSSGFAVAAGRGGDGLAAGGDGGGVKSVSVNTGGGISSKLLVIAGDGGDAYAALATSITPLAFGSKNGLAGNGGSIEDLAQPGSILTRVDLIAGNGGNTPNWGVTASLTSGVGNGGSIKNVSLSGDIGNVASGVAIKAYNNIASNERISDFVARVILGSPSTPLSDTSSNGGNVGIVVGSNGRVRDSSGDGDDVLDPSTGKSSGSLINVSARNIMSAVAGSVDRINAIANVSNLTTSIGSAIYGADKGPVGLDYFRSNGDVVSGPNAAPEIGGKLLDGAIVRANKAPAKRAERDFILG